MLSFNSEKGGPPVLALGEMTELVMDKILDIA